MKPVTLIRIGLLVLTSAAITPAGCSSGSDGRAVVSVDRQGRAVYATHEQQAQMDRTKRTNQILSDLARGERTAQSLSAEERQLVGAALEARKHAD